MQQVNRQPLRPAIVAAAVAAFATTGTMTAACSRSSNQYVNCVDDNGQVVDPSYCDDNSGSGRYWYYTSSRRHKVGSKAPSNWQSHKIDPSDAAARSKAGLPSYGKIGGTKVSSKGFGKSGSGSRSGGS